MYTDPIDQDHNDRENFKSQEDASQGTGENINKNRSNKNVDDALMNHDNDSEDMASLLSNHMMPKQYRRGDYVDGIIVSSDREGFLVDIGTKSEAILPFKELMATGYGSMEQLKVNDKIHVIITQQETSDGHAVVSVKRARQENIWAEVQTLKDNGEIIVAEVKDSNRGGLLVEFNSIRGFVPISQLAAFKRDDRAESAETQEKLRQLIGKALKLKIIEVNRSRNRLILSERDAAKELRDNNRDALMNSLEVNAVIEGVVSNLTNFGAFVDIGGADGLVHISEMSYSHINNPSEILHTGQHVRVMVKEINKDSKRIALTMKLPDSDPWHTVLERYPADKVVKGSVMKLVPFGAFVRLEDGIDGLIHTTEIYPPTNEAKAILKEGDVVEVKILKVDIENRRLRLSMRALFAPDVAAPAEETEKSEAAALTPDVASDSTTPITSDVDGEPDTSTTPAADAIAQADTLNGCMEPATVDSMILSEGNEFSGNSASL